MSNQDEFENLIRNFKLDNVDEPRVSAGSGQQQKVFNYDEDIARSAQQKRQPQYAAPPVPQRAQPQYAVPQSAHKPAYRANNARYAQGGGSKKNFQVRIDDRKFYEPSAAAEPRTARGGGGGGGGNHGGDDDEDYKGGGNRWVKAIAALVIVVGISVFLAFFALESASDMFGLNKQDGQIEITLPENQSLGEIAALLNENGMITQPLTFQLYAGLKSDAADYKAGTYVLDSNMSYDQIIIVLKSGNAAAKVEVQLTFYEGMTLLQIADKLEENKVCSKEDLFTFLEKDSFTWEYEFLAGVPDSENRFRRYEGYFFPDTYNFVEGEDVATVVQKFFANFNRKMTDEKLQAQMKERGLTLDQTLTLASIIQKEAGRVEDMKMVSSIFHNRLSPSSPLTTLGSDVTIFYVEDNIKPFMETPNQQMYDAYNTYVCKGLPVGPICNPGMDAIDAVLNYEPTSYYYFLADREGKFYYANTLAEHEANIQAAGIEGVHGLDIPEQEGQ